MRHLKSALLVAPLPLLLAAVPARAADVTDLRPHYAGPAHSVVNPAGEDLQFSFDTTNPRANGKFIALMIGLPIEGKVTTKGLVTIVGKLQGNQINLKINLHGRLSAAGKYLSGYINADGTLGGQPFHFNATFDTLGSF